MDIQVEAGAEADLDALTALYNHYVRTSPITFDTEPFTPSQRRPWLLSHAPAGPHRLLVARAAGQLLGYATSGPLRPKPAYLSSVEVSVYCAPQAMGQGVGTLLYQRLFSDLSTEDVHRAYAGIAQPNEASHRLHVRFGFQPLGTYREVGRKFGRYWDVTWYEKPLGR